MKYVLWDWNGTLLDDTRAAIDTLNIQLRARGVREISTEFYRAHFAFPVRPFYELIGMGPTDANWDALAREYHAIYAAQPKGLNVEAVAALQAVRAAGAGQSVLSALRQDLLDEAMRTYGPTDYFEYVYGVDNLDGASKLDRARELVERLVAEGRCRREEIVMIGDALHDKEVADALGVGCVLCAQGGHSYDRLVRVAPTGDTLLAAVRTCNLLSSAV